ncbi:MAG: DUF1205 domain-containing protein [Kutzneria sp.]|nr:DUF1205 domain-containing protein [Kutzneria sp.]MBV9847972.1 DUF1205 domain-containing protein [Kutzneria sp.]
MRALFIASPGVGHVFPIIPLAWALRSAGHEVLVATSGEALVASKAGLSVVDVAPEFEWEEMIARVQRDDPALFQQMATMKITDLREVAPVFGKMTDILIDGIVDLADRWRPDVVVQSLLQGSGLVVGGRLGIPVLGHGFGFARSTGMDDALREQLKPAFDRYGVTEPPASVAYVDVAPPSMVTQDPAAWPMRYVPYNGGGVLPSWLREMPAGRPRIAVTLGTVAPRVNGLGPVERIIAAAPDVDAEFVVALGDADSSGLGELPPNVHIASWIPLNALLEVSSALVHHGGAGTTMTALAAGVPQLVLPSGADRHINATAVHARGAGLSGTEEELDAESLRRLLTDEKLIRTASEVSAEMAAMPSPADVAERVARLVS